MMLPHVIRYNGAEFGSWYRDLLENTGGSNGSAHQHSEADSLAELVEGFVRKAKLATRLSDSGVRRESLPALAIDAAKQWTGKFNPRLVEETQLLGLYEQAF
jgi:alcohol dehydrogenase